MAKGKACLKRWIGSYWPVLGTATGEQVGATGAGTSPAWSCSNLLLLGSAGWQKSLLSLLPAMLALESVGAAPGEVLSAAARAASSVIWFTTSSISCERPAEGLTEAAGGGGGSLGLGTNPASDSTSRQCIREAASASPAGAIRTVDTPGSQEDDASPMACRVCGGSWSIERGVPPPPTPPPSPAGGSNKPPPPPPPAAETHRQTWLQLDHRDLQTTPIVLPGYKQSLN
ncbi:hypothetical protein C0J52_16606 [Blattella germanica]|nr:hypothetical protein C0J52_16606 [Blattella germanica]